MKIHLTAQQIFACVFTGITSVGEQVIDGNQITSPKGISFSRFPAVPAVRIVGTPGQSLTLQFGMEGDKCFAQSTSDNDQIIISDRWYPIDLQTVAEAKDWLSTFGINAEGPITLGQLISVRMVKNPAISVIDQANTEPANVASCAAKYSKPITGLEATLYPYQEAGVAFLKLIAEQSVGCILADEMGLGKTLQLIALLQSEKNLGKKSSLVIAPATLLENWRREIAQFAPSLSCLVHTGPLRAGLIHRLVSFDVVITSFDTAIRDEVLLSSVTWNLLAIDEAQAIKNPESQRSQTVKRIPRRVSIALTGTPVENRLSDLWSISDFALPGLLGKLHEFQSEFSEDIDGAGRLAPVVSPILLRRRVAEVAKDLPEKIEILQAIEMGEVLSKGYEELRLKTMNEYGPAAGMVATTRLRIFCAHPELADDWPADGNDDVPKYQRLFEILSEICDSNEKALVFTSFLAMSDRMLVDAVRRWPNGYFRNIDGRIAVALRQPTVDEFFSYNGFSVLFLNPKAAGTGLNITAANHVIHYNPEWNPAVTVQATGRAYRRKQVRPVTIHHLYYANSVEEVMVDRAEFKSMLAGEAVIGHEGNVEPSIILRALEVSPLRHTTG